MQLPSQVRGSQVRLPTALFHTCLMSELARSSTQTAGSRGSRGKALGILGPQRVSYHEKQPRLRQGSKQALPSAEDGCRSCRADGFVGDHLWLPQAGSEAIPPFPEARSAENPTTAPEPGVPSEGSVSEALKPAHWKRQAQTGAGLER